MFRYLLITVVLSVSIKILSQEYQNMNFETGQWITSKFIKGDGVYEIQNYCDGDTVINDTIYYKLFEYRIHYPIYGLPDTTSKYIGAIRNSENKKIIIIRRWTDFAEIIYDFNLNIGDTIKVGYGSDDKQIVQEIDSVEFCGIYHKRYITWKSININPEEIQAYIEGIGSSYGLIDPIFPHFESYSDLVCYTETKNNLCKPCKLLLDYSIIAEKNICLLIYPNPVKDMINISLKYKIDQVSIFSSFGRLICFISKINNEQAEIKVNLNPGIYLIKVQSDQRQFIDRFIVY